MALSRKVVYFSVVLDSEMAACRLWSFTHMTVGALLLWVEFEEAMLISLSKELKRCKLE